MKKQLGFVAVFALTFSVGGAAASARFVWKDLAERCIFAYRQAVGQSFTVDEAQSKVGRRVRWQIKRKGVVEREIHGTVTGKQIFGGEYCVQIYMDEDFGTPRRDLDFDKENYAHSIVEE